MLSKSTDPSAAFRGILARNVSLPLVLGTASAIIFLGVVAYLTEALRSVERTDQVISRAYAVQKLDLDMESALRGYLITGEERLLRTFEDARQQLEPDRAALLERVRHQPVQLQRLEKVIDLQQQWDAYAQEQIARKRREPGYMAGPSLVKGIALKIDVRTEFDAFVGHERRMRVERVQAANRNATWIVAAFAVFMLLVGALLAWRGRRDLTALSDTFEQALAQQRQQAGVLQAQAWLREGQSLLAERLAGEQSVGGVGRAALEFFAAYLGSVSGVLWIPREDGSFSLGATWGWAPEVQAGSPGKDEPPGLPAGRTLVTESAAQRRQIRLAELPAGYLQVSSSLGQATVQSVLISPLEYERRLCGVVELGFLRALQDRDADLLAMASSQVGAAVEAARTRRRLQDILEETQQLNEELQVQQEELRTANEELEEQSRALKESQANLENQQAELEQTNLHLSEQSRRLEDQRDELRHAQAELQRRAHELERASQYKSEFLANMSHELRTPLNSALILARLLAENGPGNLDAEQVKYAQAIHASGTDLLTLINDILDIAKVEAGKLEVQPGPVSVQGLLEGLRSMFEPLAAQKGLRLAVELQPGVPAQFETDRQRVEQILKNLLANAVKFTDTGGVTVLVREQDGRLVFDVRDSGIGIEASQHELIFEAFRQADGTVSRKYGGTGLGLSISRDLARLLGGTLTVASVPGQGSTFTLALPSRYAGPVPAQAPEAPAATLPVPAAASEPVSGTLPPPRPPPARDAFADDRAEPADTRRTVLVVEDDEAFARILFDLAHDRGYRCLVAQTAQEGIELAAAQRPHAVLLDMRLPDGSGLSVLQHLKEDPRTRHIPVHVLSVEDLSQAALQMGAVGYALKPASHDQLRAVFDRIESKLSQKICRVLLVEDDARQRESVSQLIGGEGVEIVAVAEGAQALEALSNAVFDCMIIDLKLPDMSGQQLLERMAAGESRSFPPVIVYTGRELDRKEEAELMRYSRSIIIKGARSPERLLDEVTLFLHQVETDLPSDRQRMLRNARNRERAFEGRRILVVDDDVRNIFALTSALEQKGATVAAARNGIEALQRLDSEPRVDLILMDIMMPEMDGYTAMREIRRKPRWARVPIIAVTAKAMRDDQEKCLAAGASDYLAKPIELERLFSLIRVWLPKL